jgi:hypothetical protein
MRKSYLALFSLLIVLQGCALVGYLVPGVVTSSTLPVPMPTATITAVSVPLPTATITAVSVPLPTATITAVPVPLPTATITAVPVPLPTATIAAVPVPLPTAQPTPSQLPISTDDDENQLFNLLNNERTSRGLESLTINNNLAYIADMESNRRFSHNDGYTGAYGSDFNFEVLLKSGFYPEIYANCVGYMDISASKAANENFESLTTTNPYARSDFWASMLLVAQYRYIGIGFASESSKAYLTIILCNR